MYCKVRIKSEYISEIKENVKKVAESRKVSYNIVIRGAVLSISFTGEPHEAWRCALKIKYGLEKAYGIKLEDPMNASDNTKIIQVGIKEKDIANISNVVNTNKTNTFLPEIKEKPFDLNEKDLLITTNLETKPNRIQEEIKNKPGVQLDLFEQPLATQPKTQLQKSRKEILEIANLSYLENTLEILSLKFGLPYEVIFDENNPNKGYVDVISYNKPTIIINAAIASNDTPLHEYGHIFINLIKSSNKNLYSNLIKEVLNTKEGKKELNDVKQYYSNYTLEEQIEETIVELLGKYAKNEFDPESGIHKTIKKIWNNILEFLSKAFNVNIKDISPNTSIEQLAKLLSNPNINFNQKSFIEENIELIKENNIKNKERLEKEYEDFKKIENPSLIKENDYTLIVNEKEFNKFKTELEITINSLKAYSKKQLLIDINNIKSKIKTFEQRDNFNYNEYPLFTKILPFIHPNLNTALWVINNEEEKGNLNNKIKNSLNFLDNSLSDIIKEILSGYNISKKLEINIPNFYKISSYKNNNFNSVEEIKNDFKDKLSELNKIIQNPKESDSYYDRKFKFSTEIDTYSVNGKFKNGNINISFSSDKYGMKDVNNSLFFKVLPKVIDSISYMFSDLEYNTISFHPISGESKKGSDLRLKGYNIFAKRLFGQFSLVAENENTTTIPIPEMFKNQIHIKENMYQKNRNIKPGVEELFETDSNLANQVYEALGFKGERTIETAKGSTYRYLPSGKTQRFKKVEGKEYEPQDILTFVPNYEWIKSNNPQWLEKQGLENDTQYTQYLLEKVQGKDKVWIVDSKGKKVETNQDAKTAGKLFIAFGKKDGTVEDFIPVSKEPVIGFYTYDSRIYFDEKGERYRDRHLGNKVVKITEGITPQQKQQALQLYSQYLDTTQNQFISSNDKVVFGHPTIGKSFLKKQGEDKFITLDDDYANEVNAFVDANRGTETRQEYKGRKPKEYNEFMLNLYDRLKAQAQREGKILFVSNTNILKERMSDFDRVITIPKAEFKRRFDERGATYGFEDWKSDIDATVAKVPDNKVITTTGYLADLFRGSKKDIQGFKEFVEQTPTQTTDNFNQEDTQIINNLINEGEIKTKCD